MQWDGKEGRAYYQHFKSNVAYEVDIDQEIVQQIVKEILDASLTNNSDTNLQ